MAEPERNAPLRPVLLIGGAYSGKHGMDTLCDSLCADSGYQNGGSWDGGAIENPKPKDLGRPLVFTMAFSRSLGSPADNAEEIRQTVRAIQKQTGAGKVDVVCHSKGGIDLRTYLQESNEAKEDAGIGKVIYIGTPHHGVPGAPIGMKTLWHLKKHFNLPIESVGDYKVTQQAAKEGLKGLDAPLKLGPWTCANRFLTRMNSPENLARERRQVESQTDIVSDQIRMGEQVGLPIPSAELTGDGLIPVGNACHPDPKTSTIVVSGVEHCALRSHRDVCNIVGRILGNKPPLPEKTEHIKPLRAEEKPAPVSQFTNWIGAAVGVIGATLLAGVSCIAKIFGRPDLAVSPAG